MARKIVLFVASSLDGHIAREDGRIDWLFTDGDYGYSEFYDSVDALLMGRKTFDQALGFGEYPYKGRQVYVFSHNTRKKPGDPDGVEFVSSGVADFAKQLKQRQGRDIWLVGGAEIISILLNAKLVDRIILSIHPVILGRGIPLFKDVQVQSGLKLTKSVAYDSELVQLHYDRA